MSKVITFGGKAESGKTFSAKMLQEKLQKNNQRCLMINFADALKFIATSYFGWDGKKDDAGRRLLQNLGTDIVRKRNPNFWVNFVIEFIKVFSIDYDYFLITDLRFRGEYFCFLENDIEALSINVVRLDFENGLTDEQRNHPSERDLDDFKFDYTLSSKSGLDNLSKEVDRLYDNFLGSYW